MAGESDRPRDFTVPVYLELLDSLQAAGYEFQTFSDHLRAEKEKVVLLRHDVDDRKLHSLAFARLQHERGIVGSYYFRMVPQSFDKDVIREIHGMGHEVGYHYEEMDLCKGDPGKAYDLFRDNLEELRSIVPITTICMHGSPWSRFDNKDLWRHHNYRDHGIVGEPYFDLDFDRVAYFTDTGRCWDGGAYSVRDRVYSGRSDSYHHTLDMVDAIRQGIFPEKIMLNFHPQRWTDSMALWVRDAIVQQVKNQAKSGLIKWRSFKQQRMS